ncbi:MAG: hypothetical protein M0P73_12895 [Syntrophobacterales bacterium]|jgi:hypothetical protein|nr:hypothetical protein [Syntrophobacterales bacterium]
MLCPDMLTPDAVTAGGVQARWVGNVMHAYYEDLIRFVRQHWSTGAADPGNHAAIPAEPLPPAPMLEDLFSTCYQVGMLREEERPVQVRLVLADPELFPAAEVPPLGLHRQMFAQPRPCDEMELRKLSPAVDFSRSLIGVHLNNDDEWEIWGIVHSGTRWLQAYRGGRKVPPVFPKVPVILVNGPGRLAVLKGMQTVATLVEGRIITPDINVFEAGWIREYFAGLRTEILAHLASSNGGSKNGDTLLDPNLIGIIGKHQAMRIISTMRESRQGGTLLYLPHHRLEEFTAKNPFITIKYQFREDAARQRLVNLMQTLKRLTETYNHETDRGKKLGWQEYVASSSGILALLEEAVFEAAHQVADFAAVDGAVVLTNRNHMLGFGGMIKGDFDQVNIVARALDAEGDQRLEESTENVGTRHRSVYYLCHQIPGALGTVISQDGNVRFIKQRYGQVTYWEQAISFALKIA